MDKRRAAILIVDDQEDLADMLADVLRLNLPTSLSVDVAYGGIAGEAAAHADGPYDVVITDLAMPAMDGFQVGASVRAQQADVLLIAISGNSNLVEVARSGRTFDHALLKPVQIDALVALLSQPP